jgi:hypothetical protein
MELGESKPLFTEVFEGGSKVIHMGFVNDQKSVVAF